jgi:DNA-binding IclR family transcriptional regulator
VTPGVDRGLTGRQPKAVQSALAVLEEVARAGAGVTAKEVAEELGLPPATTYRLLNLLVGEEFLVRLPDLHGFALGRKAASLAGGPGLLQVPTAVREVVAEIRGRVRHGVHLVLVAGTTLHPADTDPDHPLRSPELLQRHLHASAVGKVLLADAPDWRDVVHPRRLQALTARTVTRGADLEAELRLVRARGCAVQGGQLHEDVSCAAVPVRSPAGVLVGVLAVSAAGADPGPCAAAAATLGDPAVRLGPLLG